MAPIDDEAAEHEVEKAVECVERADALTEAAMLAANTLLERASEHIDQAAALRGVSRLADQRRSRRRRQTKGH